MARATFDACLTDSFDLNDLLRLLELMSLTLEHYTRLGPAGGNAYVEVSGDLTQVTLFSSHYSFLNVTVKPD